MVGRTQDVDLDGGPLADLIEEVKPRINFVRTAS